MFRRLKPVADELFRGGIGQQVAGQLLAGEESNGLFD